MLRQELLLAWLPKVEAFILPDATHLLHVQNPRAMAAGLAAFFARHPLYFPLNKQRWRLKCLRD